MNRMNHMMNCWFLACMLAMGWMVPVHAATPEQATFAPELEVADIPTASALYARMFHLNFRAFRGGGILIKGLASFNNSLSLGLALKASNVIGNGRVQVDDEPVRALAKFKLFAIPRAGIQAAAGYDGMPYDVTRQKGLYGVMSKDLAAGVFFLRAHAGAGAIRFKSFDAGEDVNLFFGVSAALSEEISLGVEYDDVLYRDGSVNAVLGYAWDVGLRLELDFKSLFRGVNDYYRVLKILYTF